MIIWPWKSQMREILAPYLHTARNLDELRGLVVSVAVYLKSKSPNKPIVYIGGPITTHGPDNITRNLSLLYKTADHIASTRRVITYTNPYAGDLRRFPNVGEKEFSQYSTDLLRSGVFAGVIFLEGWQMSKGCNEEYRVALTIGIPVQTMPLTQLGAGYTTPPDYFP